jgi:hypothetical protein
LRRIRKVAAARRSASPLSIADLDHGVVELPAARRLCVLRLEGGDDDLLDGGDHPDDEKLLGHQVALDHGGP